MNRSDSIVNLSKALLKAQQQMESAKKDSANPFFKSKYLVRFSSLINPKLLTLFFCDNNPKVQ